MKSALLSVNLTLACNCIIAPHALNSAVRFRPCLHELKILSINIGKLFYRMEHCYSRWIREHCLINANNYRVRCNRVAFLHYDVSRQCEGCECTVYILNCEKNIMFWLT
jgi:hypothetical protein